MEQKQTREVLMSVAPAPASRRPTARIAARAAVALLLLALLAGCAGKKENANRRIEAVARSSPTKAKVLLNNDDFVVLEFTLQPGDFVPPYWGGKRVVYPLTSHRLKKIEEGEEPYVEQVAEGEARWHDNEFLSVENVGEDPARYIVFSRREAVMEAPADSATVKRMMGADP
jgi:hypothetical protein